MPRPSRAGRHVVEKAGARQGESTETHVPNGRLRAVSRSRANRHQQAMRERWDWPGSAQRESRRRGSRCRPLRRLLFARVLDQAAVEIEALEEAVRQERHRAAVRRPEREEGIRRFPATGGRRPNRGDAPIQHGWPSESATKSRVRPSGDSASDERVPGSETGGVVMSNRSSGVVSPGWNAHAPIAAASNAKNATAPAQARRSVAAKWSRLPLR